MTKYWKPVAAIAAVALLGTTTAQADGPTVTINSPTDAAPVFCADFASCVVGIDATIVHTNSDLSQLTQFDVQVNNASIIGGQLNPFKNDPDPANIVCTDNLFAATTSCVVSATGTRGDVVVPWTITQAGEYVIFVKARHQSVDGSDSETIDVQLLSAEYPAPPAVANAYIKSQKSAVGWTAKQRGCVISLIAQHHGQGEKYGPKPGPYDQEAIEDDVDLYFAGGVCTP